MAIALGVFVGIVMTALALILLAKVVSLAVTTLAALLPGLIVLWFIVMILKGMVRTVLR